jgi:hypothetical protein
MPGANHVAEVQSTSFLLEVKKQHCETLARMAGCRKEKHKLSKAYTEKGIAALFYFNALFTRK